MQSALANAQTSGLEWCPIQRGMAYQSAQQTSSSLELPIQRDLFKDLELQMARFENAHQESIVELKKDYLFPKDSSVTTFLRSYRSIIHLLFLAVDKLREAFGPEAVFLLRVSTDELGSQILFGVALWPGSASDAHLALKRFDENWWIANVNQSSGYLNFTYELV